MRQLRFRRLPSVKWLSPGVLASTAARLTMARLLGAYLDKRELLAHSDQGCFDHRDAGDDGMWIDFVADIGDGFDATYSVAYLLGQQKITVDGVEGELPRGDILIMGGDEVYPAANWRDYENRTKGPYQAANPAGPGTLYAIPGNHDWLDGLTAFQRMFGQHRTIGGWQTVQRRSYFAARLPYQWWLLGIDAQFDAYLDQPQMDYFERATAEMQAGDKVILCVPQPSWTWTMEDPQAFDRVDFLIRTVVTPKGATVPLVLSGDRHHYAHYAEVDGDRHMVTAGGGGAYLSPTHNLPESLHAPPRESMNPKGSPSREFRCAAAYPTARRSWQYAAGVFWRLPWLNPGFVGMLGIIHLVAMVSMLQSTGTGVTAGAGLAGVAVAFARPVAGARRLRHWVAGVLHGLAHIGLAIAAADIWRDQSIGWEAYLAYIPIGGVAGTLVTAAYLLVASRYGVNDNELFAGQSIPDSKCFLRMHLTPESLLVYPIGLEKASRRWRADPHGADDESWIVPREPLRPHLIEPVFEAPGTVRTALPLTWRKRVATAMRTLQQRRRVVEADRDVVS